MSKPKFTISFQRDLCIGCNYCVENASSRWAMSKRDGKSVLLDSVKKNQFWVAVLPEHERQENEKAAKNCPVKIIKISS